MTNGESPAPWRGVGDCAIYLLNRRGRIVACNYEGVITHPHRAEDLLGREFLALYATDAESGQAIRDALRRVSSGARHIQKEMPLRRRGGQRFHALVSVDALRSTDEGVKGFVVIICDRSDRKGAEDRLRESERRFRLLVKSVADHAICMLGQDGTILDWNLGAQRMTGFGASHITGQHYRIFFHPHDRAREQPERLLRRAAQNGQVEYECDLARVDGQQFPACLTLESVQNNDGSLLGFACIIRDITEQRLAEQRLREAREQIAHSQKVEAIGQLTGGIAHDFNNSLQGIISSLEMAMVFLEDSPNEQARHYVQVSQEAAMRAGGLTQRLLGLARRQAPTNHRTDVGPLLWSMRDVLARLLSDGITLEVQVEDDLPPLACDGGQLESAILNLAINARDAMGGNGYLLLCGCLDPREDAAQDDPPNRQYVEISVADNGQGMDEETLRRACEPFFTTKAKNQGTGLGLAMVSGFVAQHGGKVAMQSKPGCGTVVSLVLPCSGAGASAPTEEPNLPEPDLAGFRVLVVENDHAVRASISARLNQLGCQVFEATTGREALLTFAACPSWDLLLSDIDLPELDGYELCREARRQFPRLRVILMTGYVDSELLRHEFTDRYTESLLKPFDMGALLTKLRLLMGVT
ncbi:hybrid sensor histidine kinase/response regulator [Dyella sedimenti]|uniref:hybrid sensor histidine kinase/response regulator n=1 Tax=Dyella sedimenti TaxID=2919947 RepID=UPI001FAB2B92|nr:PAS domain-containing sensor histidine kinase [Dyella sedimenti]